MCCSSAPAKPVLQSPWSGGSAVACAAEEPPHSPGPAAPAAHTPPHSPPRAAAAPPAQLGCNCCHLLGRFCGARPPRTSNKAVSKLRGVNHSPAMKGQAHKAQGYPCCPLPTHRSGSGPRCSGLNLLVLLTWLQAGGAAALGPALSSHTKRLLVHAGTGNHSAIHPPCSEWGVSLTSNLH